MEKDQHATSQHTPPVPIAVIGMGCIFPKARNLQEYWHNIKEGVDAITDIPDTHWNPDDYYHSDPKFPDMTYAKRGGFLPSIDFNPLEFGILPNALEATDTSQLLSLVAAQEALKDAGYLDREFNRERVSVILGVTGALELVIPLGARLGHPIWRKAIREAGIDPATAESIVERIGAGYVEWQENSFPGLLGNVVAGRIANRFDFGGTNCAVDAACASSLSAVHLASMELANHRADMVVAGGVDTFNHIFMYVCFSKTPALSPSGHARPFDRNCDGTTLGEGVGIVVLKRLDDAKRDGDKIYAVIQGIGSSSDGKGNAIYAPSSDGQARAFHNAYKLSGITPETIELMEAHGTGTKAGDAAEITSMTQVYQAMQTNGSWCALGSVKSQIGHAKSAAGVAGLIKAIMALHHKTLPPTIKVEQPAPALAPGKTPFYVNTEKRPWAASDEHPRRAAVSSFGFGGSNFHCVLEEFDRNKTAVDWSGEVFMMAFCGDTLQDLQVSLDHLDTEMSWKQVRSAAATSRQTFDSHKPHRLVMVLEQERADLAKVVKNARMMLEKNAQTPSWNTPDGIYYGSGEAPGKLGIIFPGQGAQYVGMLRDLACQFPTFQAVLETGNRVFQQGPEAIHQRRLSDLIYPQPAFSEEAQQHNEGVLRSTQVAQPAIGAVSLGLMEILAEFGVQPEAVAGHSYGELVSLCTAGVLDVDTFFAMSRLRGELMGRKAGDKGSMLAVQADEPTVMAIVQEAGIDLVIANKNSPQQTVLSGATDEVERAVQVIKDRGVRCTQLNVAAAFHSAFVSDASGTFLDALQKIHVDAPKLPVFADSSGEPYPEDADTIRKLLAGQLANPVEFIKIIGNMYALGVRTFLEVGPSSQMNGMIQAILTGKACDICSVDASKGKRSGETDLARALSQLAALGYDIHLNRWDEDGAGPEDNASSKKRAMSVPISGANYVKPKPAPPVKKIVPATRPAPQPAKQTTSAPQPATPVSHAAPAKPAAQPASAHSAPPTQTDRANAPTPASPPAPPQSRSSQKPAMSPPAPPRRTAPPAPASTGRIGLDEALRMTQENLRALQQFQQQNADLHRQFLEGQDATRQSFEHLFAQQQRLLFNAATRNADQPEPHELHVAPQSRELPQESPGLQDAAPPVPLQEAGPTEPVETPRATVAAPPPTPAPQPEEQAPAADTSAIESTLLKVVAEKTGYPEEMLDLDMGLDADLGIDSIKRVEILSALQERLPNAPEISAAQIGSIQTLRQIVEFLAAQASAISSQGADSADRSKVGTDHTPEVESLLLDVVAEKTGYPVDMLDLDMGLDADLGIDSIKRVEIFSALQERLPHAPEIRSDQLGSIQNLRQIVDALGANGTHAPAPEPEPQKSRMDAKQVETILLQVVSEKTGYPIEMLDLNMGLDADLGIDSIKRVEILSALQERLPQAPEITSEHLGAIQTLLQIVDFLSVSMVSSGHHPAKPKSPKPAPQQHVADAQQLSAILLEIVADKTGYPVDMLALDMGLDADLGIDSIKRVEILSALQERLPQAPEISSQHIGQIQTLRQIVEFLSAAAPGTAAPSADDAAGAEAAPQNIEHTLLTIVADKTGYPADMLDLDMGLDADLGIDSIKRVEILSALQSELPDAPEISADQIGQIQTLRQIAEFLSQVSSSSSNRQDTVVADSGTDAAVKQKPDLAVLERSLVMPTTLEPAPERPAIQLASDACLWVTDDGTELSALIEQQLQQRGLRAQRIDMQALPQDSRPDGLILIAPGSDAMTTQFARQAFFTLQQAGKHFRETTSIFATVSRLDGAFGFAELSPEQNVFSGGLAGLTKTVSREWPQVHCRAFDLAAACQNLDAAAARIVTELFREGPVEVGISESGNTGIQLEPVNLPEPVETSPFNADDVILVTGGARGVTAACAIALASTTQATLLLLGRSPAPEAEPDWLADLQDEAALKKAIIRHATQKMSPKEVEQAYRRILANREIQQTLTHIHAAGARALYRSVDVRDRGAVQTLVHEIQNKVGPIRGLIHGAGVLADRKIEEKTPEQFDRVYGTKVEGILNLLEALPTSPLKAIALFSSTTARLGRVGQVDYAIANETLNKIAQQQARRRPDCRVVAINWGPWAGGMVTPALEKVFAAEGVGLIPLHAGAEYFVREFTAPTAAQPVEVVLLGKAGLPEGRQSAPDSAVPKQSTPAPALHLAFERQLNLDGHPFLNSHVLNGRAVLPVAVMIEWLAHAALHNNPGLKLRGFNDLRVLKGVRSEPGKAYPLRVLVGNAVKQERDYLVPVEMQGRTPAGRSVVHARAEFVLSSRLPQEKRRLSVDIDPYHTEDIYDRYLFHGPDFQGIEQVDGVSAEGIIATVNAAPAPSAWIAQPLRNYWLTDPLMLDCGFQLLILWCFEQYNRGSLPTFISRYRQCAARFPQDGGRIIARVTTHNAHRAIADLEFLDLRGTLLARMDGYECTLDASLQQAFQCNSLLTAVL